MYFSNLRIQISVILFVWMVIIMGCSPGKTDEPSSGKPIQQFSIREGKRLFQHLCLPCHGESGRGDGIFWASSLDISPADLTRFKPAESSLIFKTIKHGSKAQGKSNFCPPWKNNISDEEIEYIVSYVETLQSKRDDN